MHRMTTSVSARAYQGLSLRFGVRCGDAGLSRHLESVLAPLCAVGTAEHWYTLNRSRSGAVEVRLDGVRIVRAPDAAWAAEWLLWHVNCAVVAASAAHVVLHAGGVARDGSGVLVPGPSGSGKTTLVAGLVRRGCAYLSDEAMALAGDPPLLLPYPKALALDAASWRALFGAEDQHTAGARWRGAGKCHVLPERIRAEALAGPSPARVVVVPRYRPGGATRLDPLGATDALVELVTNAVNLDRHGGRGVAALASLAERRACYRLEFSDLDDACRLVLDALDHERAEPVAG